MNGKDWMQLPVTKTNMILDDTVNQELASFLTKKNEEERRSHSGKLMASMLGMPTLWQILSSISIPDKPFDAYTLAKFKRGQDVEKEMLPFVKGTIATQKEIIVGHAKGYADAIIDTQQYAVKCGVIPLEIKSVTNAKFRRILKEGAQKGHLLQGGFYALGEKSTHFGLLYVASDDYRTLLMIEELAKVKEEITSEMQAYEKAITSKMIPVFDPKEKWHTKEEYMKYIDWCTLSEDQIMQKLQSEFPTHYQFFMSL